MQFKIIDSSFRAALSLIDATVDYHFNLRDTLKKDIINYSNAGSFYYIDFNIGTLTRTDNER